MTTITASMIEDGIVYCEVYAMKIDENGDETLIDDHVDPDFYDVVVWRQTEDLNLIEVEEYEHLSLAEAVAAEKGVEQRYAGINVAWV